MRSRVRRFLPDGSVQEQVLESIALTFGRGTENAVELPGAAVAPRHAKLSCAVPGRYLLESTAPAGLEVNGVAGEHERELVPGDAFKIGEHLVTITPPDDAHDLVIEVQLAATERAAPTRREERLTLGATGLGYRRASWILAGAVLLVTLLLPLVSRPLAKHWPTLLPSDRLWTAGRISGGHAYFGDDCAACHKTLLVRVRDDACLSCHAGTRHHSDDPKIRNVSGFAGVRCATCHREHDAVDGLAPRHPEICTDCHAKPSFPDFPDLKPAGDFGKSHPAFRPTVSVKGPDGTAHAERRDQSPDLKDAHGLIFNHALHLDPKGVRVADGVKVLACADCHAPDASRMGFVPFSYEKTCSRCHALDAQLGEATVRLPHGSNDLLRELLDKYVREAAAHPASAAPAPADARRVVGEAADRGKSGGAADELRRTAGRLCGKCHEMQASEDDTPRTRPLSLRSSWLVGATFTHAQHEAMDCQRCHAAAKSQYADDLMLPTLGDCRTCHAGVDSPRGVSSTCIDCHRLHRARQPWTVDAKQGSGADAGALRSGKD